MNTKRKILLILIILFFFLSGCSLVPSNESVINEIKHLKFYNEEAYYTMIYIIDTMHYPCCQFRILSIKTLDIRCGQSSPAYSSNYPKSEELKKAYHNLAIKKDLVIDFDWFKKTLDFHYGYIFKLPCEDVMLTYFYYENPNIDSLYKGFEITKGEQIPEQDCNWVYIIDEHWIIANYSKD